MKAESIGPHGLVYVCAREFAVTHPHDNKISVMGTDDITTSHIIVIKHSGENNAQKQNVLKYEWKLFKYSDWSFQKFLMMIISRIKFKPLIHF